jgi:hypothetical protein
MSKLMDTDDLFDDDAEMDLETMKQGYSRSTWSIGDDEDGEEAATTVCLSYGDDNDVDDDNWAPAHGRDSDDLLDAATSFSEATIDDDDEEFETETMTRTIMRDIDDDEEFEASGMEADQETNSDVDAFDTDVLFSVGVSNLEAPTVAKKTLRQVKADELRKRSREICCSVPKLQKVETLPPLTPKERIRSYSVGGYLCSY